MVYLARCLQSLHNGDAGDQFLGLCCVRVGLVLGLEGESLGRLAQQHLGELDPVLDVVGGQQGFPVVAPAITKLFDCTVQGWMH